MEYSCAPSTGIASLLYTSQLEEVQPLQRQVSVNSSPIAALQQSLISCESETSRTLGYDNNFKSAPGIWVLQDLAEHHVESCKNLVDLMEDYQRRTFDKVLHEKRTDENLLLFHAHVDLLQRRIRQFAAEPVRVLETCQDQIRQFQRESYHEIHHMEPQKSL